MDGHVQSHGDEPPRPYSQDLSSVTVDPAGLGDPSWISQNQNQQYMHPALYSTQLPVYPQHYQNSPYAYTYDQPQADPYAQNTSYLSEYGSQYQHTASTDPYNRGPYGVTNSHVSAMPAHLFQESATPFPFPTQVNSGATVSPQALDRYQHEQTPSRNDGSSQYQRPSAGNIAYSQNWLPNSQNYGHDPHISDGYYGNTMPVQSGVADNTSYRLDDIATPIQIDTTVAKVDFGEKNDNSTPLLTNSVAPVSTNSVAPNQQVRITHPDLLASTSNNSSARLKHAKFAALGDTPIELAISNKGAKIPVYRPRPNRNGEIIIPGRDRSVQPNLALPNSSSVSKVSSKSTILKQDTKRPKSKDLAPFSTTRPVPTPKPPISTLSPRSETSSPEDESSSSEDSDATDDDEMDEQEDLISNHRVEVRPTDIAEAATWDAIGVTFISAHRRATPEETGNGINELEKLISRFRVDIKKANSALALSKTQKPPIDTNTLSKDLAVRRKGLVNILNATVQHGHIDVLENLGKNEKLIAAFGSMLVECFNDQDLAGELPKAILMLMTKIKTLTDIILDKVKFFKVAKRFVNNSGDAEVKTMIESIKASTPEAIEKASKENKAEVEEKKAPVSMQQKAEQQKVEKQKVPDPKQPSVSTTLKRAREPDTSDSSSSKIIKKLGSDVTGVSAQKVIKASSTSLRTPVFTALARSGQKHQIAAAKPTVAKPAVKPEPPKHVVSSAPRSLVGDILSSIQNPNPPPETAPSLSDKSKDKEIKDESPAEKAKREVKERRRLLNLRVRFPEKPELEKIKYFTHDQAEDEGRQGDLLRDANSSRSEGMMHRQQVLQSSNPSSLMDINDGQVGEVEYLPYPEIQEIDFSLIDQSTKANNYTSRAGSIPVDTPQQHVQYSRESTQLIVIYTDPSDIPNSPKEPVFEIAAPDTNRYFRQPGQPWVVQRLQEIRQYGPDKALLLFIRKAKDQETKRPRDSAPAQSDLTSVLNSLKDLSAQTQPYAPSQTATLQQVASYTNMPQYPQIDSIHQSPAPTSTVLASSGVNMTELDNLTKIFASFKGKPYPPTEPPDWYKGNKRLTDQWWEGYYRDNPDAARQKAANDAALQHPTQLFNTQVNQPPIPLQPTQYAAVQSYAVPPPNSTVTAPPAYDSSKLMDILAGLNNAQSNSAQPQQQDWSSGWAAGGNITTYDQDYASQNRDHGNQVRWDGNRNENENTRSSLGSQAPDNSQNRGRDGGYGSEERHSGGNSNIRANKNGDYKRNTKPCKFWLEGKCAKGANCTFRHD